MKLDSRIFIGMAAVAGIALAASSGMQSATEASAPADPAVEGAELPEGHPDISNLAPGSPGGSVATVTGVVEEAIRAAGYTYVRLTTDEGEIWVAGPEADLEEGEEIGLAGVMNVGTFESASLGRTFDPLFFADRFVRAGVAGRGEADMGPAPGTGAETANAYQGTVLEAIPVSRYVYLRVEADDGTTAWLAAPAMEVGEGDEVAWSGGTMMRSFSSSSLDRTFDEILFVTSLEIDSTR